MTNTDLLLHFAENSTEHINSFSTPIIQASNFKFETIKGLKQAIEGEKDFSVYSRGKNPTVRVLEEKMAALEKTDDALAFASGIAAITAGILNSVKTGSHIIAITESYSWAKEFFEEYLPKFGISTTYVSGNEIEEIKEAIQVNTSLIYLESPSSWFFNVQDLQTIALLAKQNNIRTICDNSFCSPLVQNPTEFGIDLVLHSASKYLGGHSDVVAGILCGPQALINDIFAKEYMNIGAIMAPQTAFLILRGLRTLHIRLERVDNNRKAVVEYLSASPYIDQIIHPFTANQKQQAIARKQMSQGNGLFSVLLSTQDPALITKFCESLKRFSIAVSWGGHESLLFPALAVHSENHKNNTLPINMIRFYVGLDDPKLLLEDLDQALKLTFLS